MELIFFILFSLNSSAIDEIRLDLPPYPGSRLLVANQQESGLCYAYSAAYLIDYERNDPFFKTSPLLLAIDYKDTLWFGPTDNPDGGEVCSSIKKIKRIYKKELDQNLVEDQSYYATLLILRSLYDKHSKHFKENDPSNSGKKLVPVNELVCSSMEMLKETFGISKGFSEIEAILSAPTFTNFLARSTLPKEGAIPIDFKCDERVLDRFGDNRADLVVAIEKALELKKPAAIGYCGTLLNQGSRFVGIKKSLWNRLNIWSDDCKQHASVVVGKRVKEGRVQYLIQDSHGEGFSYHPDFEIENHRIWIDQEPLVNNLISATYLE